MRPLLGLALTFLAVGCPAGDDDDSAGATDAPGSTGASAGTTPMPTTTTMMTDNGGGSTAGSGDDASSDGATTAAPDCPEDTPPAGREVTVTVTNDRADAIFVTSAYPCAEAHLRIDTEDGSGLWPLDACAPTCASIIADACACPEICMQPRIIRIEPGASHDLTWDGALWVDHVLDDACNACGVAPDCLLGVSAPRNTYLASVSAASSAANCTDERGQAIACECAAGETSCVLMGSVDDPRELAAQSLLDYPAMTELVLVLTEM